MQCVVLGGGSWGTALAIQLARNGHRTIWTETPTVARREPYPAKPALPPRRRPSRRPDGRVRLNERSPVHRWLSLVCLPTLRADPVKPHISDDVVLCCATKGIEQESLHTMHEVMTAPPQPGPHVRPVQPVVCARGRPRPAYSGRHRRRQRSRACRVRSLPRRRVSGLPHR